MSNVIDLKSKPARSSRPLRILVADDNPDTVLTLSALLADEGHEVRSLSDGSGVLQLLQSFDPDVCVLDIEMPGKDGYILARELSDRRSEHRPLLVAISGVWTRPSERFLALLAGFDHFFQKPADPNELLRVLEQFRQHQRAVAINERVHLPRSRG
ncbi:MAG TPA: response regulator [Burkholderiales bacterium]